MRLGVVPLFLPLLALTILGCSPLELPTTPKPPPDNPNPPALTLTASWSDSSFITLTSAGEDLMVTDIIIAYAEAERPNKWYSLQPDLYPPFRLYNGVTKSARVRLCVNTWTPGEIKYYWAPGHLHRFQVGVHRPGQSTTFWF